MLSINSIEEVDTFAAATADFGRTAAELGDVVDGRSPSLTIGIEPPRTKEQSGKSLEHWPTLNHKKKKPTKKGIVEDSHDRQLKKRAKQTPALERPLVFFQNICTLF